MTKNKQRVTMTNRPAPERDRQLIADKILLFRAHKAKQKQLTTTLEILKAARELLSVPERWTTGVLARAQSGYEVTPSSAKAVSWCMSGACLKIGGDDQFLSVIDALDLDTCIPIWNDAPERTHAEVLARFDTAIAKLEAQQ